MNLVFYMVTENLPVYFIYTGAVPIYLFLLCLPLLLLVNLLKGYIAFQK